MPGRWTSGQKRLGTYVNFESKPRPRISAPLEGIVAIPLWHDWGPLNEVVTLNSVGEWYDIYGPSIDTGGWRAVYQAFKGEGVGNRGGAAQVKACRIGGTGVLKASIDLANTIPDADALVVEAVYEGARGNDFKIAVEVNAANPTTHHDIVVLDGTAEIERYPYVKIDLASVAADINAKSGFVRATVGADGVALAPAAAAALTGGDDGSTLAAGDWTNALALLGQERFGIFVPFDLTDPTILASIKTWAADPATGMNARGRRFEVVVGGGTIGTPDTLTTALSRSDTLNNENFTNVGGFRARDTQILDSGGVPLELTPSTLAPRIAGIIAARGVSLPANYGRLLDVELVAGLSTDADFVLAGEGGVLTIAQDSHEESPVRIEDAVTTYQDDTAQKSKEVYGNLKFVRVMQRLEMAITEAGENNIIGRLPINRESREYMVGIAKKVLNELSQVGAILDDYNVVVSQDPPPSDTDDFIALDYFVTFGRDVRQLRNKIVVS